ncbi:MAG: serine hydrolase [Flavihumibacter sp.]
MRKISLLLILYCLLQQQASAQRAFISDSLDRYIERNMADWKIPGVAVAVVKQGKTIWKKGYGVLETGKPAKVSATTRFGIGSNSKAFTATALAMLQAAGKLSLDDKVKKWIPDFRQYDPWITEEATVRDLLCHRMGFETFQGDFMYFDSDLTYAEVKEKFGKLKPQYGFRSRWGYTNAAFAVAGEVIEKASGQTWGRFIDSAIFRPLQMTTALPYSISLDTARNTASAHTVVEGVLKKIPYGHIDNLAPAGSISASVEDLSHWAMALLDNGNWNGKTVIAPEAIALTRQPNSILGNARHRFNRKHFSLYGLGWMLEDYAGTKIVSHTGGVNGFVTAFTLLPEENAAVIVLTNTDANGFYSALNAELTDAVLNLPYRDYSALSLAGQKEANAQDAARIKKLRDTVALKPAPALPLQQFLGDYVHDVYGHMNITMENGKAVARFEHHKGRFAILEPLGGNRFLASFNDPLYGIREWPFRIENGKVLSVTVSVSDFVEFTTYDFVKQ